MTDRKHIKGYAIPALLAVLSATSAGAEPLTIADYRNELQRCITELRPELNLRDGDRVLHLVSTAKRNGYWYRFDIDTTVTDEHDVVVLDRLSVECRAHRAEDRTLIKLDRIAAATRTARR